MKFLTLTISALTLLPRYFWTSYQVRRKTKLVNALREKTKQQEAEKLYLEKRLGDIKVAYESERQRNEYLQEQLDLRIQAMIPVMLEIQYQGGPQSGEEAELVQMYIELVEHKQSLNKLDLLSELG